MRIAMPRKSGLQAMLEQRAASASAAPAAGIAAAIGRWFLRTGERAQATPWRRGVRY